MNIDHILGIVYAGLLGGALGSFANVLILRWHEGSSILGRSACPHCKTQIRSAHLIPILSWLWLKGRCGKCERKIHIQYIAVEAAGVVLAIIAATRFNPFDFSVAPMFWFEFIFSLALLVPVVMDIRWQELPVEYLAWLGVIAFAYRLTLAADPWSVLVSTLIALAAIIIFFGLQIILSHGKWLGMGDVWFGVFMAGVLGWPKIAVALYIAYLIGGFVAVLGLGLGWYKRKTRLAFGPMLACGVLVTMWFGDCVLNWLAQAYV